MMRKKNRLVFAMVYRRADRALKRRHVCTIANSGERRAVETYCMSLASNARCIGHSERHGVLALNANSRVHKKMIKCERICEGTDVRTARLYLRK